MRRSLSGLDNSTVERIANDNVLASKKKVSFRQAKAEMKKQQILELLDEISAEQRQFDEMEASYESAKMEVGFWLSILGERGLCEC